jgi:type II secretory pathway pseudopilin PulG
MAARPRALRGFSLVGVLIVVAVLGLVGAAGAKLGSAVYRRHAELALLDVGMAFSRALGSYARATPPGQPDAPRSLQELLLDPRKQSRLRHLRKLFADPLTGSSEWGLERDEDGRIVGIYSLAEGRPIKRAGFARRFAQFAGKNSYQDWKFERSAEDAVQPGAAKRGLLSPGFEPGDGEPGDDEPGERGAYVPRVAPPPGKP